MKNFISISLFLLVAFSGNTQIRLTAEQVNGTWQEMNNMPENTSAYFKLSLVAKGTMLKIEFIANNAEKGFSNTVAGTVPFKGNTAIFKPAKAQINNAHPCIITLKFVDGTLMVTEKGACGWGNGITSEGIFYKQIKE